VAVPYAGAMPKKRNLYDFLIRRVNP